ncbi:hypothetical protein KKI93_15650 [Xenorhabdus bovienii]|uniref:Acb2/Tad1 hairpin domain-containing protein n=1 Tax=Xenorhabdus aichiensis TaxID=3025874 RepID=A0ABT5M9D7_9GAMM|nr:MULTISPECIES: hypothetical protein [Xenorhabdus]MDC9623655.1 hypothetical protein [Xenorhabdus aichiensis]MDE9565459.1 hypothetical protein [Xenorhabdus bovienii]
MENQHRKITGYRELSQDEIDCMNKIKALGEELGHLYEHLVVLKGTNHQQIDMLWLNEGRTDLQKGIMCWVRAVAKPTTF